MKCGEFREAQTRIMQNDSYLSTKRFYDQLILLSWRVKLTTKSSPLQALSSLLASYKLPFISFEKSLPIIFDL